MSLNADKSPPVGLVLGNVWRVPFDQFHQFELFCGLKAGLGYFAGDIHGGNVVWIARFTVSLSTKRRPWRLK
jgi:hypothetical protein